MNVFKDTLYFIHCDKTKLINSLIKGEQINLPLL